METPDSNPPPPAPINVFGEVEFPSVRCGNGHPWKQPARVPSAAKNKHTKTNRTAQGSPRSFASGDSEQDTPATTVYVKSTTVVKHGTPPPFVDPVQFGMP